MPDPSFAPNFPDFHRTIGAELTAVKDRVRQLIRHWPVDGAFKESMLRYVLRRFLPESLTLGTGFIVTPDWASPQLDILIVSRDAPRLFSDGDLLIVYPDAVRWAIEVKTRITNRSLLRKTILKLAEARSRWSEAPGGGQSRASLFIYQAKEELAVAAMNLLDEARAKFGLQVGSLSLGTDVFIESVIGHWNERPIDGWLATIEPGMAAAHYVNHIIQAHAGRRTWANPATTRPTKLPGPTIKYLPHSDAPRRRNPVEVLSAT